MKINSKDGNLFFGHRDYKERCNATVDYEKGLHMTRINNCIKINIEDETDIF